MNFRYLSIISIILFANISIFAQVPTGYYSSAQGLTGVQLKLALHDIIDDHEEFSYNNLRDFILKNTDEDPNNSNNVILLYTGRSQAKSTFGGGANDWNREHVWAKSHGDFGTSPPAGTDAHHIRPTDASVNSSRGNLDFDMGGSPVSEAPGCYRDSDSFEPRDAVKGDVARMIFYMATRYDGGDGAPDLEVVDQVNTSPNPRHGKLSQLILWNTMDPPDDFENNRNDVIYYQYQNNRNPFIDHPEYVDAIWGDLSSINSDKYMDISVFPNPASDILKVSGQNIENTNYTIFSVMGTPVIQGYLKNTMNKIDIKQLQNGVYFLFIQNSTKQITTKTTFVVVSH